MLVSFHPGRDLSQIWLVIGLHMLMSLVKSWEVVYGSFEFSSLKTINLHRSFNLTHG